MGFFLLYFATLSTKEITITKYSAMMITTTMTMAARTFFLSILLGRTAIAAAWTITTTSFPRSRTATTTRLCSMFEEQNNNIPRFPKDYGNTLYRNRDSSPDAYYRNDDDEEANRRRYNNGYRDNDHYANNNNNNNNNRRQGGGRQDYYDSETNSGVDNSQISYRDDQVPEGNDRYIDYFYNERGMADGNNNNRMPTMTSRRPPPPGDALLDVLRENDRLFEELWQDTSRIFDKLNRIMGMRNMLGPVPPFSANMPPPMMMMMPPPPPPPARIDELLQEAERALNTDPACRDILGERIQIGQVFNQASSSSVINGRQEMQTELEFAVEGRRRQPGMVQLLATERGIEQMTLQVQDGAGGFREIFVAPPPYMRGRNSREAAGDGGFFSFYFLFFLFFKKKIKN